jgi:hypothetical protein
LSCFGASGVPSKLHLHLPDLLALAHRLFSCFVAAQPRPCRCFLLLAWPVNSQCLVRSTWCAQALQSLTEPNRCPVSWRRHRARQRRMSAGGHLLFRGWHSTMLLLAGVACSERGGPAGCRGKRSVAQVRLPGTCLPAGSAARCAACRLQA